MLHTTRQALGRARRSLPPLPGKMGLPVSISPRMQPSDHMSTPLVYFVEPSRISGARYHRVAT
jgi:hypothetical protein